MNAALIIALLASMIAARPASADTQAPALAGRVQFRGAAVPGAIVTLRKDERTIATSTDGEGRFQFAALDPGEWTIRIEHTGFTPVAQTITVPRPDQPVAITLAMKPLAEIRAAAPPTKPAASAAATGETVEVIDGSVVNAAATPFAQPRSFGNNRPAQRGLYNFGLSALLGTSSWNAAPYSFSGAAVPSPDYTDRSFGATFAGPLRIPWVVRYGPQTMASYERGVTHAASTASAMVPTLAQRSGDLSGVATPVRDPRTGLPFAGNRIPEDRISPVAAALLGYYPAPNTEAGGVNLQAPLLSTTSRDTLQVSLAHNASRVTSLSGTLGFQRTHTKSVSLFELEDRHRQSSLTGQFAAARQLGPRTSMRARYQLTRATSQVTPFFANRVNVSGDAGIAGNDQSPANWGPPALVFPDIAGLRDVERQRTVSLTHAAGAEFLLRRGAHNITAGGDIRWHGAEVASQPNPRGTLTFTGAATGNAFADFLLGIPSASALVSGTEAIRLRARSYDLYVSDDWRLRGNVTITAGLRWEYDAPFEERSGRMANLALTDDFSTAAIVTGGGLLRPDRSAIQPRLGASWRPSLGSSLVMRASYGLYRNLGGYQSIALLLAQQPPFATAFSVQNSAATPLTLAAPFPLVAATNVSTIAIDPAFRPASAENWQLSAQRELPWSLTAVASYLGSRGSHLMQAFAPNTVAPGAPAECAQCPSGFVYVASDARSIRHAAQLTLRRRLYAGLTAEAQYTLAKAIDNAATFSPRVGAAAALSLAQNWRDLEAERAPSSFDQRHLFTFQIQYTTGARLTGGGLLDGAWGRLLNNWTLAGNLNAGSGMPFTPIYFAGVPGTGIVGIRPRLTGESIADAPDGAYANPAAFTAPAAGEWGDAGRHSIRGPATFAFDASAGRVFRLRERLSLEWRLAATNILNRVTFSGIDTVIGSPRFARPSSARPMRALQMSMRLRF